MRRLACLLLLLAAAAPAQEPAPPLSIAIRYKCKWWSAEQKKNFNPNRPPPKETEVVIQRWEYTDPVDVPHPDTVEIEIEVRNTTGGPLNNVAVEAITNWRVGSIKREPTARWMKPTPAPLAAVSTLAAGGVHVWRIPADIAKMQKQLQPKGGWPWTLRTEAVVKADGKAVNKLRRDLPIFPGD